MQQTYKVKGFVTFKLLRHSSDIQNDTDIDFISSFVKAGMNFIECVSVESYLL